MTLVFTALHVPSEYIGLLLTVNWFLDRCRTTVNVLGDVNVSRLRDGRLRPVPEPAVPWPDNCSNLERRSGARGILRIIGGVLPMIISARPWVLSLGSAGTIRAGPRIIHTSQ
jgi:hypothetical protein